MNIFAETYYEARREADEAAVQREADEAESRLAQAAERIKDRLADEDSNVSEILDYEDASNASIAAIDELIRKACRANWTDADLARSCRIAVNDMIERAAVAAVNREARR